MAFAEILERVGGAGRFQTLQVLTLLLPSVFLPCRMLLDNFTAATPAHRCWAPLPDGSPAAPANLSREALLLISIPRGPGREPERCRRFRRPQWQLLAPNATAGWSEAATEPCVDGWVYDRSTFSSTIVAEVGAEDRAELVLPAGGPGRHQRHLRPQFPRLLRPPLPGRGRAGRRLHDLHHAAWLPESARWLILTGKPGRALQELRKVARINGHKDASKALTLEAVTSCMEEEAASAKARRSLLALLRVPLLRRRSCCLWVLSFSYLMSYYGLVLDLQHLGRDVFLLQVLFGAVDFLGRAASNVLLQVLGRRVVLAGSQAVGGLSILANMLVPPDLQALRVALAVLGKGCLGLCLTCYSVYKSELFPTSLRMTSEGLLQAAGRLGTVTGPLIMMARPALPLLPPLTYGAVLIASTFVLPFLPETRGLPLPDTIQDLESQGPAAAAAGGSRREAVVTESTWL